MEPVEQRFIRYARIDTQSCDSSTTTPSTSKQFDLLNLLKNELDAMGLTDVILTEKGYLYATLEANCDKILPVIGLIAHVDTSPDMSGENVNPKVVKYNGGDIVLNKELDIITRLNDFPELEKYKGHELIVTDGTTLLGADDKAGVAEIMAAMEYFIENPEVKHGTIKVGFTPDEEIGRGADHFDVKLFGADYAYTFDGSSLGELEYENFNAATVKINIQGRNVHPGYAKNKMLNAFTIAMEFDSLVPKFERPEYTSGYEGFYHLVSLGGSVDATSMSYIIRDHSDEIYSNRIDTIKLVAKRINEKYGNSTVALTVKEQYRNMRSVIENGNMAIVERAIAAMKRIDIKPDVKPIRGGTDGSRLSFMGLPTPNIFAGGENFHGRHEFISISVMNKAFELAVELCREGETNYKL
ncbi:MAG: peptidase T [Rikenellaceae bacterium]